MEVLNMQPGDILGPQNNVLPLAFFFFFFFFFWGGGGR